MAGGKQRVDVLLVERGVFESRAKAAAAVIAGDVRLKEGGRRIDKPGQTLAPETELLVAERSRYVSRGGIKLENALKAFPGLKIEGRDALDAGASTGGFTDCLLQHGASRVIAADVAYGELHWKLREDPRVVVLERVNVRELQPAELAFTPDLVVADLSFIGLPKVLPALLALAAERFDMLVMVKPQFEVGREKIGKGGVVRSDTVRTAAFATVAEAAQDLGCSLQGGCSSGLPGPKGNREGFLWLAENQRPGGLSAAAAAEAAAADPQ